MNHLSQTFQTRKDKLDSIAEKEAVLAPQGVNFSIIGQENFKAPERDVIYVDAAIDDVLVALEIAQEHRDELEAEIESAD